VKLILSAGGSKWDKQKTDIRCLRLHFCLIPWNIYLFSFIFLCVYRELLYLLLFIILPTNAFIKKLKKQSITI